MKRRSIPAILTISLALVANLLVSVVAPGTPALAAPQNYTCSYYTVHYGDSLSVIGRRYGVSVRTLMRVNGLRKTRIYAGQHLCIPRNKPLPPKRAPAYPKPKPVVHPPYAPVYAPQPYPPQPYPPQPYPPQPYPPQPYPPQPYPPHPYPPQPYPPQPYPPQPYPPQPYPYGAFPCTKPYFNESNLCILQPYPVKIGTTAYAVWNISDFTYGEFDRGDGQGFKGPILHEQKVDIPNVTGPRTVQLRWKDHAGNWRYDSFWIQVVY
jgi:LysM repeat protein